MTTPLHTEGMAPATLFTGVARRARHWQDPHRASAVTWCICASGAGSIRPAASCPEHVGTSGSVY
jgi:hypothetical protein